MKKIKKFYNFIKETSGRISQIETLFKSNPELVAMGNSEQYSDYLDTIFPDSKVEDIVYHTTKGALKGNVFRKSIRGSWGEGVYFGSSNIADSFKFTKDDIKHAVLLDIKNPKIVKNEEEYYKLIDEYSVESSINRYLWMNDFDSAIREEYRNGKEYFVFDTEQIHILGSKQDLEGFKKFVDKDTQEQRQYSRNINQDSLFELNNQFGVWIESLMDDYFISDIVNEYISTHPSLRIANSINILSDSDKQELKKRINRYLKQGFRDKEVEVSSTILNESVDVLAGKGVFNSFIKALTSLGGTNISSSSNNTPNNFLFFYHLYTIPTADVDTVFKRYKSLSTYQELLDSVFDVVNLYYGIKTDGYFEYGIYYDNDFRPFGRFKLTKQTLNWLITLDSKSIRNLKSDLVNLNSSDLNLMALIKRDMLLFKPSYYEKISKPEINDRVISFGYYGLGKWNNGVLDAHDLSDIKYTINQFILSKKWHNQILISVVADKFWVWVHIKLK